MNSEVKQVIVCKLTLLMIGIMSMVSRFAFFPWACFLICRIQIPVFTAKSLGRSVKRMCIKAASSLCCKGSTQQIMTYLIWLIPHGQVSQGFKCFSAPASALSSSLKSGWPGGACCLGPGLRRAFRYPVQLVCSPDLSGIGDLQGEVRKASVKLLWFMMAGQFETKKSETIILCAKVGLAEMTHSVQTMQETLLVSL